MRRVAVLALLALIRVYQVLISPLLAALGARCRFHPSCSEYAAGSVRRYGAARGAARAARRLLRCHPGHPGGVDLP
jgi:putative membrane protein insertion efficiency factor